MKLLPILVAAFGLFAVPAVFAQGCCGGGQTAATSHAGCGMGGTAATGHEGHGATQTPAKKPAPRQVFTQPVQSVFDNYIRVQSTLANDSVEGIPTAAAAISKAVRGDSMKKLPATLAEQADALGKAKDLASARAAYKTLSDSLLAYLQTQKVPAGSYYVAYCPMAKASWIQSQKVVVNPYMGKSMIHCGKIQS